MYTLARYTVYIKLPRPIYNDIHQLNDRQGLNNNCARLHVDSLYTCINLCCSSVDLGRNLALQCLAVLTHASYHGCLCSRGACMGTIYLKVYVFLFKLLL